MKLSVIVPTLDRFADLRRCIASLHKFAPQCEHEIIVIDGGSMDGTAEWLATQRDLIVLQHNRRMGCTKAFNDGFRISRGEYCAQLSDDLEIIDNCLDMAIKALDEDPGIGQVIIPHADPKQPGRVSQSRFSTSKGSWPFAAFGLTRRALGEAVGWWGDYYHQQGDVELSLKILDRGYKVVQLDKCKIIHYSGPSDLRAHVPDRALFNSRWGDWEPPK